MGNQEQIEILQPPLELRGKNPWISAPWDQYPSLSSYHLPLFMSHKIHKQKSPNIELNSLSHKQQNYRIIFSSFASAGDKSCVHPLKASMSFSYRKCREI